MTKAEIAETLKKLRLDAGYTQIQAAEHVGKKQQTLASWESGQSQPDANTLFMLCDLYRVNIDDAFGFRKQKDPTPKREVDLRKEKLIRNYDQLNETGKCALLDFSNYQLTKNKEDDGETLYVASRGGGVETRHLTREEVEKADKVIEAVLKRAEKEGWGNNDL